jgi:hypothetical protein
MRYDIYIYIHIEYIYIYISLGGKGLSCFRTNNAGFSIAGLQGCRKCLYCDNLKADTLTAGSLKALITVRIITEGRKWVVLF